MPTNRLTKAQALQMTKTFLDFAAEIKEEQTAERVRPAMQRCQRGLFRLVVIGEINRGKSSFINALLGVPALVPVQSDVATSTVYQVTHGATRKYTVFFYPPNPEEPDQRPAPLDISVEQLYEYGTADGNPDNRKGVDYIRVQVPHPWLEAGLVIADTPGLGALFREHSDITWRYVPNADAVFFVLDSVETVMTKQEVESLQKLRQMTSLLYFVQTKIDLVGPDQQQKWRDRNLDIIAEHLQMSRDSIPYFPVSNKLKELADRQHSATHLARSGFDQLQEFFHTTLLGGKEDLLARALLQVLATEAAGIRRRKGDALRVLDVQTKEELETLGREFTETKTQFEQWRTNVYQRTIREFQDCSADLRRATIDGFQNQVDPSPQGLIIRPIMEQVRESELKAEQLNASAKDIQSVCINICSQEIMQLQSQYHQDMKHLIATTSEQLGRSCTVEVSALARGVEIHTVEHLNMQHVSGFDTARTALSGGAVGSTIAIYAASLLFPPAGAAVAVASLIGLIGGALLATRDRNMRTTEEARTKLQNTLIETVRLAQRQGLQQFQATAMQLERTARDAFDGTVTDVQQELQDRLKVLEAARTQTREESQRQAASLRTIVTRTEDLLRTMGQMVGTTGQTVS